MRLYKQTELFILSSCFLAPLLENSASPFHSPDCSIFCRHGCSVQVLSLHSQGSPLMIFRHVSRGFRSLLLPTQYPRRSFEYVGPFSWFTRRCKCKRKCEFKWVHASNANARKVRCASAVDDRHRKFSYALPSFFSVMVEDVDVIGVFSNCAVMAYTDGTCVKKMKSVSFHASTLAFAFSFALE